MWERDRERRREGGGERGLDMYFLCHEEENLRVVIMNPFEYNSPLEDWYLLFRENLYCILIYRNQEEKDLGFLMTKIDLELD